MTPDTCSKALFWQDTCYSFRQKNLTQKLVSQFRSMTFRKRGDCETTVEAIKWSSSRQDVLWEWTAIEQQQKTIDTNWSIIVCKSTRGTPRKRSIDTGEDQQKEKVNQGSPMAKQVADGQNPSISSEWAKSWHFLNPKCQPFQISTDK